jgi:SNW domain-containing protein 1
MANVGGKGEVAYDSRLFNQEQGMASGFAAEDSYNLYDKPLFATRDSNLFRPVRGQDDELYGGEGGPDRDGGVRTDKFKADRGFTGGEDGAAAGGGSRRGGAVEYESAGGGGQEADPFGLEQFMEKVDRGRRPLDGIGTRGGMAAGGGGGGGSYEGGGSSRRMEFTSSGSKR